MSFITRVYENAHLFAGGSWVRAASDTSTWLISRKNSIASCRR